MNVLVYCLTCVLPQELTAAMYGETEKSHLTDILATQGKKLLNAHRLQVRPSGRPGML